MGITFEEGKKEMKNMTNDDIEKLYTDSIFTSSAEAFAASKVTHIGDYELKGIAINVSNVKDVLHETRKTLVSKLLEAEADAIVDLETNVYESANQYFNIFAIGTALVKKGK